MNNKLLSTPLSVKLNHAVNSATFWAIAIFGMVLLYNLVFTPNFFHIEIKNGRIFGSLVDIVDRSAPVILMAIGMTFVIASKGIDISVGSVAAISGAIAAVLITRTQAPLAVIIGFPLLISIILGAWNGFLVSVVGMQPIIATLILMVTGRGIAQLVTDGQIIVFRNPGFEFIGSGYPFGLPFAVVLVICVSAVMYLLSRKTALGLFIESIGINARASNYAGIHVPAVTLIVYVISGLSAGLAGLIYCSDIRAADSNNAGLFVELDAILAVVIGGTSMNGGKFSLLGTVFGVLIIQGITTTILTRGVPVEVTFVIRALVVVAVCVIQSPSLRVFTARLRKRGAK